MSRRATVLARTLGFITVAAWLAVTDARLLLALSVLVPIWIGAEIAIQEDRHTRAVNGGRLLLWRHSGERFCRAAGQAGF